MDDAFQEHFINCKIIDDKDCPIHVSEAFENFKKMYGVLHRPAILYKNIDAAQFPDQVYNHEENEDQENSINIVQSTNAPHILQQFSPNFK